MTDEPTTEYIVETCKKMIAWISEQVELEFNRDPCDLEYIENLKKLRSTYMSELSFKITVKE